MKSTATKPTATNLRSLALLACLVTGAPLLACSDKGGDSGSPDGGTDATGSTTIGAAGGTLQAEGGAQVEVPAGALDSEQELTITQGDTPADVGAPALPADFSAVSTVVLTPHGTQFAVPATLSLPYSGAELGDAESELVLMRLDDLSDTEWEPWGHIETGGDVATTEIDGFSYYSLANVAAGTCPCWTGAEIATWKAAALADGFTTRNSWVSTGRVTSQTCNFVRPSSGSIQATHTAQSKTSGASSCSSAGEAAYGGTAPATTVTLDAAQYGVCRALLTAACFHDRTLVQLAVYSPTLPTGETVGVSVTATDSSGTTTDTSIAVDRVDEMFWSGAQYDVGTTWTVAITSQPASATCTVVTPTGTLGTDNVAVEIDCSGTAASTCPCDDFTTEKMEEAYVAAEALANQEINCFMGPTQTSFGESPADGEVSAFEIRGDTGGPEVSMLWGLGKMGGELVCRVMEGKSTISSETDLSDDEYEACLTEALDGLSLAGLDPTTCEN